jgi:1-acyl-sn-glycerol-3-phosphate acyltransferase
VTFYRVVRDVLAAICRTVFRLRVIGGENVPVTGAFIVAPTHRSLLDIPFTACITKRRIRFLAKQELFGPPVLGWAFTKLGGIPVERGSATARGALKALQAALAQGEPAAVFPEGTREHGRDVAELFDGAAYLSVKLGLPILPVGIAGSEEILASGKVLPNFHRVVVVVGTLIEPPPSATTRKRSDLAAMTADLRKALQSAFDEAHAALR